MWFIGVEVEQETSAPPAKKNPGSAPVVLRFYCIVLIFKTRSFDRIIRLSPRESEKNALSR